MKRIVIILIVAMLIAAPAFAAAQKIGCVDLLEVMDSSTEGVKAKAEVKALADKYGAEYKAKGEAFEKKRDAFTQQAPLLADDARGAKEAELQREYIELQQYRAAADNEIQKLRNQHSQRILGEMRELLQKLGKDNGYTMIIEVNEGAVFYYEESIDLTAQLLKAYDASKK
ncbi:MAG: hypothetical protein C0622_09240 [Desulfuromonas sp.]|nr:MAG: hypothetical protein C0622_09240 [Desulfuromonas sp.]